MFEALFFWLRHGKQARELALRAEALASHMSALPVSNAESQRTIVSILQSTCSLLEYSNEQQIQQVAARPEEVLLPMPIVASPQPVVTESIPVQPDLKEVHPAQPDLKETHPDRPETIDRAPSTRISLSATAQDLMKLSDWILLAKAANKPVEPKVLSEIHRQLIKALAKEEVTLLDETGLCDYERQAVVGTQPTDDAAQNDHIYSSVRPGYLFREQVLRPQEVIVYVNEASS